MLTKNELMQLAKVLAKAEKSAPVAYSYNGESYDYSALNETFRRELNEYAATMQDYEENKHFIFGLIEKTLDERLPQKMELNYAQFAEVMHFNQGDKVIFRRKHASARLRARQFITRVGLAGRYEVFRLANPGEEAFEIRTSAIGGAAQIGFEEFLDGRVDFAELTQIVMDGLDQLIYEEIGQALAEGLEQLPPNHKVVVNGFDEAVFDELLIKAAAYGAPQIYCTEEFAVKMVPQEAWIYTDAMKTELHNTGRLAHYKGRNIIIIPQGFKDETLTTKVVDPGFCWVIPSGVDFKPVKIAFEGGVHIREVDNHDWSRDIQVYQKVGVACLMDTGSFCYVDSSLQGMMDSWSLEHTVQNVVVIKDNAAKEDAPVVDEPTNDEPTTDEPVVDNPSEDVENNG